MEEREREREIETRRLGYTLHLPKVNIRYLVPRRFMSWLRWLYSRAKQKCLSFNKTQNLRDSPLKKYHHGGASGLEDTRK